MAEEIKYTKYITKKGDRWSKIALLAYGNALQYHDLILDNRDVVLNDSLEGGLEIFVRIVTDPVTGAILPPWENGEIGEPDKETEIPEEEIPTDTGPPVKLAFANGFPKVVGNKIQFAINKLGTYAYSVDLVGVGPVFQSPLYLFTPGQPISTNELSQSGFYIVTVGTLVSERLTVQGVGALAFAQLPTITKGVQFYQLKYAINKTGNFPTKITNLATGLVIFDEVLPYETGAPATVPIPSAGSYHLDINNGVLGSDFLANDPGAPQVKPDWLLSPAGYRYDANSHDFTLNLGSTELIEVCLQSESGTFIEGINQDSQPWNSNIFNQGKTDYVTAPYTQRFSFNPLKAGTGGITPGGKFRLIVRRRAAPGEVFTIYLTAPAGSTAPGTLTEIDLGETTNTCALGPNITSIILIDDDSAEWTQEAIGVQTVQWDIQKVSDDSIVRSGLVTIINSNGQSVFNPSNQPKVSYAKLDPGDYRLRIQGGNCSSTPNSRLFTIEGGGTEPGPGQCARRPTISGGLKAATKNLIRWTFDGDGVFSLDWYIDDANRSRLRSGRVNILEGGVSTGNPMFNPANTPQVTFLDLPDGAYIFGIKGGNCISTPSEVNFTISSNTTPLPTSSEAGLKVVTAGGQKFRYIDDKHVTLNVNSQGYVRIVADETIRSWNGQKNVNLWLLNDFYRLMRANARQQLLSPSGMKLPQNSYHFPLYYINPEIATNFPQILSKMYIVFGAPPYGGYESNSGQVSHIYLEVIDL